MRPFAFERAADPAQASRLGFGTGQGQTEAVVQFLAGGTTLIDLMKLDVLRPQRVVDIGPLRRRYEFIEIGANGLHLGAFATMSKVADHPGGDAGLSGNRSKFAARRERSTAQHGHPRWQCAAENPMPVLS